MAGDAFQTCADPSYEISRRLIVCLISSSRAHPHSPWRVKTNKILVICSTSSPGERVRGGAWVCVMSPSLTPAPTGPPSPMASCVGGGRPPQHNVSATCRLRSRVQMCNETNTGEGFCLGESEDGNCPAGVTSLARSLTLGQSDVWRVGTLALRLGFPPEETVTSRSVRRRVRC